MTLSDLLTALYDDHGYGSSPASSVTTRLTRYLNEGYRTVLSQPGMGVLRHVTQSFASVASQRLYGLPQALVSIESLTNITQGTRLDRIDQADMRLYDPQGTSSGSPQQYADVGYRPVQMDPAATGLWVVSSIAGDTTQTALVEAVSATAKAATVTVALNGTTRAQVGTVTDYNAVLRFEISAVGVGFISLYDAAAAGNELARIAVGKKTVQYQTVWLWPTPSAADTYQVDGTAAMADLSQTYDIPLVPEDFHYVLLDFARMREYEYRGDDRVPLALAQYQSKLKAFRHRVLFPADYRPTLGDASSFLGGSNLGGTYPPGRW